MVSLLYFKSSIRKREKMTVKELIEILKTLEQNEKIYIFGNPDSDGYMSIVDIKSIERFDDKIVIHDC